MGRNARLLTGIGTIALGLALLVTESVAQTGRGSATSDACSLLTNDEIEKATATTVRSSRPGSVPDGSECRYQMRAGFALTITISGVDPEDFEELRGLFGGDAQPVAGVGDSAYFLENERIYMRVGRQQFVASRGSPGDAKFRESLLAMDVPFNESW